MLHNRGVLDVRRLRLLYELSRRGTIAAVGAALHISPSAVSQQLALLESEAGAPLLERVGRGVRLTEAGLGLAADAAAVLARLERAEADLAARNREPIGTVRMAVFQSALRALVPPALRDLAQYPRLRVEVVQLEPDQAVSALLSHDIDLMLGEEYPGLPAARPPALLRDLLCHDPLRLAVPPDDPAATLAELADRPWAMEPRGSPPHAWATGRCRQAGFEPDVRYETEDLLSQATLVQHGHAVAFLPDLLWHGRPPDVRLHRLPDAEREIFTLTRTASAHHPATRAVREALRTAIPRADLQER